ncbi:hypothetical protein LSTR_LSTR005968 [Laodelphax striatellus]|uniref:Uncharacterized protein n=1 Tax=Laodelphax striatellus TaxID=195883 RepID=A0A482WEX2_LAOST|nr:hypothetical protein LSTR_LSTR005968 [Laodelphax striatellus]
MTTPNKSISIPIPTLTAEIFPKGLQPRTRRINPLNYYLSSFASESDEYESDVPEKDRAPLLKNNKLRHLKLLKRPKKNFRLWTTKIDESEAEEVRQWTNSISNRLAEFDINPVRNRDNRGKGISEPPRLRIVREKRKEKNSSSELRKFRNSELLSEEEEERERESFPFVETFYSTATETDHPTKEEEEEKKKKKEKRKNCEVESTTDCETTETDHPTKEEEEEKEKKRRKKKKERSWEVADSTTDCESLIEDRKKKKKRKNCGVESTTDCESTIVEEDRIIMRKEGGREGSVCGSESEHLSVSSVGKKEKKKKTEERGDSVCGSESEKLSVSSVGKKEKKKEERSWEVADITTDCESLIEDRKKKKKTKERAGSVCDRESENLSVSSLGKKKKKKTKEREGSVCDSESENLSVNSVGKKEKKKKGELVDNSDTNNWSESGCEVEMGGKREEKERMRMKRQRESGGSEDGGGRSAEKQSKRRRNESETECEEGEYSRMLASKRSMNENIVEIGGKGNRKSLENRSASTNYSENFDSDASTNFDFRENVRKNREKFLRTVMENRSEKRHSMSDESDEDGGLEKSKVEQKRASFESCLRKQRMSQSPTKSSPKKQSGNTNVISESSDSDSDRPNRRSSKSPIKKAPVSNDLSDSDRPNRRSSKSPIKKAPVSNDLSDSDRPNRRSSLQQSEKSPTKKPPVNNDSSNSDSETSSLENKRNDKNLKLNSSSLKKSTANDENNDWDIFEQDNDEKNNDEESNSSGNNRNDNLKSNSRNNRDKSRNSDSGNDSDLSSDKSKNNLKSNSDKNRNSDLSSSVSNSDSESSKKQRNSKKSPLSKQVAIEPALTTKPDATKSKSKGKANTSLLNSSEIDLGSQELFKTPSHKKKTATSTPFHSQMTQQGLEQIMDMSAISNRDRTNNSSKTKSNSSRADKSDDEISSPSDEEGSTVQESSKSYSQTIIPKLWKRIEKKVGTPMQPLVFRRSPEIL